MIYDPTHANLLIRETDNAKQNLVTHQERALRNELSLALGEILRLQGDSKLLDWVAAHWESQRSEDDKQPLLGGRAIENPTGSLRDALKADIARQDVGAS